MKENATSQRWLLAILLLLTLCVFINYIDRGNLSTAAPLIKNEFRLSASQLGFLLTSFFITYTLVQPFVGWLCDRLPPSRILLAGFTTWSLATILTGFTSTFAALFALRLVLGAGEAAAFPCAWKIICECFDERRRGVANGALLAGAALGPAVGIVLGGFSIAAYGWRAFFVGFGIVSMIWILPWLALARKCETLRRTTVASHARLGAILSTPSLWGTSLGHVGSIYVWYFMLTWIPYYLVQDRHFPIEQMAVIGGAVYVLTAIGEVTTGWIGDGWIAAGGSPTLVRKSLLAGGLLASAGFLLACALSDTAHAVIYLMCGGFAWGVAQPNAWAASQTMAGPHATGRWTAIQNTIGSLSGVVAPALTGVLVDRTGSFVLPFTVAAAMATVGAISWVLLVGPVAPIDWSSQHGIFERKWHKRDQAQPIH